MKILATRGTGFIGRYLIKALFIFFIFVMSTTLVLAAKINKTSETFNFFYIDQQKLNLLENWLQGFTHKYVHFNASDGTLLFAPGPEYAEFFAYISDLAFQSTGTVADTGGVGHIPPEAIKEYLRWYFKHGQGGPEDGKNNGRLPQRLPRNGKRTSWGYGNSGNELPPLAAELAYYVVLKEKKADFFKEMEEKLKKAMDWVPRKSNGLVWIDRGGGHTWLDNIVFYNTFDCWSSIAYWRGSKVMAEMYKMIGEASKEEDFVGRAELIRGNIDILWDSNEGCFIASITDYKHLPEISFYAIWTGFATLGEREAITDWVLKNWDRIVKHGRTRRLPQGEVWREAGCKPGTYSNGGYSVTFSGWLYYLLVMADEVPLAKRTAEELLDKLNQEIQQGGAENLYEGYNYDVGGKGTHPRFISCLGPLLSAIYRTEKESIKKIGETVEIKVTLEVKKEEALTSPASPSSPKKISSLDIEAEPSSFSFRAIVNRPNPNSQVLRIRSKRDQVQWIGIDNCPWLRLSPRMDVAISNSPSEITLIVDIYGLPIGKYEGIITIGTK